MVSGVNITPGAVIACHRCIIRSWQLFLWWHLLMTWEVWWSVDCHSILPLLVRLSNYLITTILKVMHSKSLNLSSFEPYYSTSEETADLSLEDGQFPGQFVLQPILRHALYRVKLFLAYAICGMQYATDVQGKASFLRFLWFADYKMAHNVLWKKSMKKRKAVGGCITFWRKGSNQDHRPLVRERQGHGERLQKYFRFTREQFAQVSRLWKKIQWSTEGDSDVWQWRMNSDMKRLTVWRRTRLGTKN